MTYWTHLTGSSRWRRTEWVPYSRERVSRLSIQVYPTRCCSYLRLKDNLRWQIGSSRPIGCHQWRAQQNQILKSRTWFESSDEISCIQEQPFKRRIKCIRVMHQAHRGFPFKKDGIRGIDWRAFFGDYSYNAAKLLMRPEKKLSEDRSRLRPRRSKNSDSLRIARLNGKSRERNASIANDRNSLATSP